MKRWMTLLLAALVLASVLCLPAPMGGIREAEAASTVTKSTVQSRLTKIQNSLNGVIWTTDQTVCDDNACTKCNTSNILKQTWFKNKAKADGLLIPSSFSVKHYYYGSGFTNGYTCCGFANYAGWYLFAGSAKDKITFKQYKTGSYTYDTMKNAMPGDIIRLGSTTSKSTHSAVVVSVSSTGVKVFDDNYTSHNKVATHTIKYSVSKYKYVTISRATNYDTTTTYTVSYDANGGYGAPASQTKTQGQTLYLSDTIPSHDSEALSDYTVYFDANGGTVDTTSLSGSRFKSYYFDGWNTDDGTYYVPGDAYTTDANVTLYAAWGISWVGSSIVLPTPARNGYTFAGWYNEDGYYVGNGGQTYSQDEQDTSTLYAHWTPKSYTVTLSANGGTCGTSTKTVTYGKAYGTMPVPTRKGYTFAGWWTAKTGGKKVTASTICYASGNYTLYARWTEGYTMTFDPNGGTVSPTTKVVKYGQQYGSLPTPTRAGYTFAGWWTTKAEGGKQVTASTVCYASAGYTLYARWTAKKFVITLNPNGGECATKTKTVTYGQAYGTMPVPSPRTGYTFAGWYTAKTGGKKVTATTVCYATANYTLYARWTPKTYTVTLNPNGGSCTVSSKTATYGQQYGTLPVPTRDGYVFAGWYTTQTTGGKQVFSSTTCYATGNYTLYARWWKN